MQFSPTYSSLFSLKILALGKKALTASLFSITLDNILTIHDNNSPDQTTLVLTYWFDDYTVGSLLAKKASDGRCLVVTKAHGIDLYEERSHLKFIPFRRFAIDRISKVICISEHGKNIFRKDILILEISLYAVQWVYL